MVILSPVPVKFHYISFGFTVCEASNTFSCSSQLLAWLDAFNLDLDSTRTCDVIGCAKLFTSGNLLCPRTIHPSRAQVSVIVLLNTILPADHMLSKLIPCGE